MGSQMRLAYDGKQVIAILSTIIYYDSTKGNDFGTPLFDNHTPIFVVHNTHSTFLKTH
jgi:hypothetical protein